MNVTIDGQKFGLDLSRMHMIGELVELIKATIDPDSIITSLSLDGRPLSDADWKTSLSAFAGRTLEVSTGGKDAYINERLRAADAYLGQIAAQFSEVSQLYLNGAAEEANRRFGMPLNDLVAFVDWYASVLAMAPEKFGVQQDEYRKRIEAIKETCDSIVQQQMFQAWFIVGETLRTKLIPALEELAQFCRTIN